MVFRSFIELPSTFSLPCADSPQPTPPSRGCGRTSPACSTSPFKPDDIVLAVLNPSDHYKTSFLSILSPSIVIKICTPANRVPVHFQKNKIKEKQAHYPSVTPLRSACIDPRLPRQYKRLDQPRRLSLKNSITWFLV